MIELLRPHNTGSEGEYLQTIVNEDGDVVPRDKDESDIDFDHVYYERSRDMGAAAVSECVEEKAIYCGDCGRRLEKGMGCRHMRIGPRGGVYLSDDPRF